MEAETPHDGGIERTESPADDEGSLAVETEPPSVPPERARARWIALAGAAVGWVALFCGGVPLLNLWIESVPWLIHDTPTDVGVALGWVFGMAFSMVVGVPGLVVAAVALAGDRPRFAFGRGVAVAVGHVAFAGIWLVTSTLAERGASRWGMLYILISPVWILLPLAIGRWRASRAAGELRR